MLFWISSLVTGLVTSAFIWWLIENYGPWRKMDETLAAQKQEIDKLLAIVESLKTQQDQTTKEADKLKLPAADKGSSVSRVQFEAEFRIYQEVHGLAHEVVAAHAKVFPDDAFMMPPAEETQKRFIGAQLKLTECLAKGEPFFEPRVYESYKLLEELILHQKVALLQVSGRGGGDGKNRKTDRKAITLALQKCADVIRNRISTAAVLA
jgi:hypothetical protein